MHTTFCFLGPGKLQDNPKLSRESLIRQSVGSCIETGDIGGALNEALKYTDIRYIDNIKSSAKKLKRPDGKSFQAAHMLKQKYDIQDKFLIYDINDGTDGSIPFVLNSSRQKVDLLHNLDRYGSHPLDEETVHLDVLHNHAKGWKTCTLSYYDIRLRELVRLATMETPTEDKDCCKLFFTDINKMLQEKICKDQNRESSSYVLNPYHLKEDEHGGNKIGMRDVFGETFVNERTSSCEFHSDHSVKNHLKIPK